MFVERLFGPTVSGGARFLGHYSWQRVHAAHTLADMTNTLDHVRAGYRLLSEDNTVADGRRRHGPAAFDCVPTITVEEIGRVSETLGEVAATVYALAVLGAAGDLAHDLRAMGPWSWSPEVWYSHDAFDILSNSVGECVAQVQFVLNNVEFTDDDAEVSA